MILANFFHNRKHYDEDLHECRQTLKNGGCILNKCIMYEKDMYKNTH
jgi:hypothetical protein